MFREIRTSERITDLDERLRKEREANEGYRKIKPEVEMDAKTLMEMCRQEFLKASREMAM